MPPQICTYLCTPTHKHIYTCSHMKKKKRRERSLIQGHNVKGSSGVLGKTDPAAPSMNAPPGFGHGVCWICISQTRLLQAGRWCAERPSCIVLSSQTQEDKPRQSKAFGIEKHIPIHNREKVGKGPETRRRGCRMRRGEQTRLGSPDCRA